MGRRTRRNTTVLLMGAALSAAPLGIATIVTPAISHAECASNERQVNDGDQCTDASDSSNQWAIDPNLSPAENLVNLQNMPGPPALTEPLIQTSLVDDVPIEIAPTLGLPGIGVGVNLWPDLTPLVTGGAGAALATVLPPPALPTLGLPQLPPPPPPPGLPLPPPLPTIF